MRFVCFATQRHQLTRWQLRACVPLLPDYRTPNEPINIMVNAHYTARVPHSPHLNYVPRLLATTS